MLYERRHKMRKNTLQDFRIQKGLTQEELAKLTETT